MFRRNKHRHGNWEVTAVTFTPPITRSFEITGFVGQRDVDGYVYGFTTLTQKCGECGYVDTTEHLGKITVPGFEWSGRT